MKEYKKSYNLKEDIDKETEKRFNEELNEIKEKLNSEKLSDEFKTNLQNNLQQELNKTEDSTKGKIFKFPIITRKLAGICACFVFLFSSCFAFADDIENVILEFFGKTDSIVEKAIAEGNYKEVDMEYVEDNGVSIKVDYVVLEDDELYIAFNVLGMEAYDRVILDRIRITDQSENIIYTDYNAKEHYVLILENKHIKPENSIIVFKLKDLKNCLDDLEKIFIRINNVKFIKHKNIINKDGKWEFNLHI